MVMITGEKRKEGNITVQTPLTWNKKRGRKMINICRTQTEGLKHETMVIIITMKLEDVGEVQMDNV